MRGLFNAVVALIVMLLAGIGLLLFRPSWWPQESASFFQAKAKSESAVPAERASPFTPPEPRDGTKRPTPTNEPVRREDPETGPPPRPTSAQTSSHFPLESEIVAGTPESVVQATFGPPEAIVSGSDLGRLQERLVYMDKSTGKKTLIFLLDGKVVGAQTYTE